MQEREPASVSRGHPGPRGVSRGHPGPRGVSRGHVGSPGDHEPGGPDWGSSRPDEPDEARAKLASALRASGRQLSRAAQNAFAQVPRHVFVPEVGPSAAYRDEALVIKFGADGLPISSSSQPAMMAIMLEQLGLEPGHRVLEIGTGSGYNAAVMSAIVGRRGRVVSVDIDAELVERARASLAAAGYDAVVVRCADGGYGDPAGAPFDRVIVTAGAWDIAPAWLDQLAPPGRLVLPLSVRGIQLSVSLERSGERWLSTSACRCGFVRMLGAFAGPEAMLWIGGDKPLYVQPADGSPLDPAALRAALEGPAADVQVGLPLTHPGVLADLDLWLTLTETGLDRVTVFPAAGGWWHPPEEADPEPFPPGDEAAELTGGMASLLPFGGLVSQPTVADRLGVAMLLPSETGDDSRASTPRMVVRGYGPGGPALAAHLANQAYVWDDLGRPGSMDLRLRVSPTGTAIRPAAGWLLLDRPNARIEVGWLTR
jgi:protein-L-isoaspartate(D-aspartate) O-methyltransferase